MYLLMVLLASPCVALLLNGLMSHRYPILAARFASTAIGLGFLASISSLWMLNTHHQTINYLFLSLSPLNALLCTLIFFVSFVVHRFSIRYMDGDTLYARYFIALSSITLSAAVMVLADNIYVFWLSWTLSNLFLILLMVHKRSWAAAAQAGWLSLKTLLPGSLALLIALVILNSDHQSDSIQQLIQTKTPSILVLGLIALAALIQSANWPFHRWLISSLNSPTPVSALMHAGLVNGGGILVVKFAPLFATQPAMLLFLFIMGAISAFIGTFYKLIQIDIKRMLASSTLAQMGFMMMQCGLGLFSAAIAHLCWHGLFKAYLFLSAGSAITQKRETSKQPFATPLSFLIACIGGLLGMLGFAYMTNKPILSLQSTTVLLVFAFIAGTQLMLTILHHTLDIKKIIGGLLLASLGGIMYGESIHLIEVLIPQLAPHTVLKLNAVHVLTLILFITPWALFNLGWFQNFKESQLWCWIYVQLMNGSQPAPQTITSLRTHYHY